MAYPPSKYMISTSTNFHWVRKIVAGTNGDGVLKLTFEGDPEVSDCQYNHAEVMVFTDDIALVDRLIGAINGAAKVRPPEPDTDYRTRLYEMTPVFGSEIEIATATGAELDAIGLRYCIKRKGI
ncbi:hypothetical protein [Bradyrhizobium sp.]